MIMLFQERQQLENLLKKVQAQNDKVRAALGSAHLRQTARACDGQRSYTLSAGMQAPEGQEASDDTKLKVWCTNVSRFNIIHTRQCPCYYCLYGGQDMTPPTSKLFWQCVNIYASDATGQGHRLRHPC